MRDFPPVSAVVARLREVLGAEAAAGDSLLKWWVRGSTRASGAAVWLDSTPPAAGRPCEVWVTRPDEDLPERCPIGSMSHLDEFLARLTVVTRSAGAVPVHGAVCPGEDG